MKINKLVFLFTIILLVSSCGENSQNTSKTKKNYTEFGNAYLIGKDINLWSEMPNIEADTSQESLQEDQEPLLMIDASEPLYVTVLIQSEAKLVTHITAGKEWLRIRYGNEEELKEGFVDYSNVFSDKDAKILYAIQDDADDRIKISPRNYSTSSQLDLAKQHSPASSYSRYEQRNTLSKKSCDLYDAALILNSLDDLKKGEYETKQEFSDRKDMLRNLSYSTGAREKVYAFSGKRKTSYFDYDVDTETMKVKVLEFTTNFSCPERYGCSGRDHHTYSNLKDFSYTVVNQEGFDCPVNISEGIEFELGQARESLGKFNLEIYDDYRKELSIVETFKIDRNSARTLKEAEGLFYSYIVGLSIREGKFDGRQWRRRDCYGFYPNETCSYNDYGSFTFSSNIEYLILFNETGNVVKTYFTSNYLNNYLQNDLLIQKYAFENKSILEELDSLDEKEQLAKLFFNRIKE